MLLSHSILHRHGVIFGKSTTALMQVTGNSTFVLFPTTRGIELVDHSMPVPCYVYLWALRSHVFIFVIWFMLSSLNSNFPIAAFVFLLALCTDLIWCIGSLIAA